MLTFLITMVAEPFEDMPQVAPLTNGTTFYNIAKLMSTLTLISTHHCVNYNICMSVFYMVITILYDRLALWWWQCFVSVEYASPQWLGTHSWHSTSWGHAEPSESPLVASVTEPAEFQAISSLTPPTAARNTPAPQAAISAPGKPPLKLTCLDLIYLGQPLWI